MKPASPLSDIFSLGVVFYETLTRRRPFDFPTEQETANAILHLVPPAVSDLNPAVEPDGQPRHPQGHGQAAVEPLLHREGIRRDADQGAAQRDHRDLRHRALAAAHSEGHQGVRAGQFSIRRRDSERAGSRRPRRNHHDAAAPPARPGGASKDHRRNCSRARAPAWRRRNTCSRCRRSRRFCSSIRPTARR